MANLPVFWKMVEAFCSYGEHNPFDSRNDEVIRKKLRYATLQHSNRK
jgi:hypothetical protein